MVNRWVESSGLLDVLGEEGIGCIAFSPLAQGLLTARYLEGVPDGSRAAQGGSFDPAWLDESRLERVRGLDRIAQRRGQSLAQLALAWVLREPRVTSALIGVSSLEQLEQNLATLERLELDAAEIAEIDSLAADAGVNIWAASSEV